MKPDLILLDYRRRSDLASACAFLEQDLLTNRVPRIALINQSAERCHVPQPGGGINDIFVTPIFPAKLVRHILSILPGSHPRGELDAKVIRYADIELNPTTHKVTRGNRDISLGLIEFKLLRYFLEHPEQVIGREEIYAAVWLRDMHTESRIVDIHIGRLRKALGLVKGNLIRTVRSIGYILSAQYFNK